MDWTHEQIAELQSAGHRHLKAGVRVKALAVLAVARGNLRRDVGAMFDTDYHSVGKWVDSYREHGLQAFEIAPGRGRPRKADDEQVHGYVLQSPRNFGVNRSRWTLQLLADTVPSLKGFTPNGVREVLRRLKVSYKRGQAWPTSPDPEFEKKKAVVEAALEHASRHPASVVALFQDEASFYRQPTQGWLWADAGRAQPHMPYSHSSNTLVRAAGCLDAITGVTHVLQAKRIDLTTLIKSYREVLGAYPNATMIYLIQDNWPVHDHDKVRKFLSSNPRLQVLHLPTYAPRLNPIEKLWRWVRQRLCHAHPFCDNFTLYKAHLRAMFEEAGASPAEIRRYCGLDNSKIYSY